MIKKVLNSESVKIKGVTKYGKTCVSQFSKKNGADNNQEICNVEVKKYSNNQRKNRRDEKRNSNKILKLPSLSTRNKPILPKI